MICADTANEWGGGGSGVPIACWFVMIPEEAGSGRDRASQGGDSAALRSVCARECGRARTPHTQSGEGNFGRMLNKARGELPPPPLV